MIPPGSTPQGWTRDPTAVRIGIKALPAASPTRRAGILREAPSKPRRGRDVRTGSVALAKLKLVPANRTGHRGKEGAPGHRDRRGVWGSRKASCPISRSPKPDLRSYTRHRANRSRWSGPGERSLGQRAEPVQESQGDESSGAAIPRLDADAAMAGGGNHQSQPERTSHPGQGILSPRTRENGTWVGVGVERVATPGPKSTGRPSDPTRFLEGRSGTGMYVCM